MIIPQTFGNNITIEVAPNVNGVNTNATLQIFGNLQVNGLTFIEYFDQVIVYGNLVVSNTGALTVQSNNVQIYGDVITQGNIAFVGNSTQPPSNVTIGGSFTAQNGAQNITFVGCVVTVGSNNTSQGNISAPGANITIGALTVTKIKASITAQSVILRMDPVDKGQSLFGTYQIIQTTPFNLVYPVTYEQGWVCGDYQVNGTISTNTSGLYVNMNGNPLTTQSAQYCCFETCVVATTTCSDYMCNPAGYIVGWIVGGVVAGAILIVSCTLFARDFIAVVKQK